MLNSAATFPDPPNDSMIFDDWFSIWRNLSALRFKLQQGKTIFIYPAKMKTIGQRIDEIRRQRGLTKTDIWKPLGLSSGAYTHWMNGGKLNAENLMKVAAILQVDVTWLETGKESPTRGTAGKAIDMDEHPEYSAVKRVRFKLSAGVSGYEVEYLTEHLAPIYFRRDWLKARGLGADKLLAVEIIGQSMEPSLFEGDVVVINTADTVPQDGEPFAANYDGELVIKRLKKDVGEWFLSSDNQDKRRFPDKRCDERTILIGKVVYKQSERV